MKKINLLLFFFLIGIFQNNSFAQTPSASNQEVVLEVSTVTSKNYNEVKTSLNGISGVTLLAYCEQNKCFLLSYNPTVIESTDQIEKVIQQLNPSYKTKIKTNIKVDDLIDQCLKYIIGDGTFEAR